MAGTQAPEQQSPPKKRGRPKGSKNKTLVEQAEETLAKAREIEEAPEPHQAPAKLQTEEERKEAYMNEIVKIEFMNLEEPGMMIKFAYGTTRDNKKYTLLHGGKYDLPRKVVQHLESRQIPIYKYRPDGEGGMRKELVSYKPRFQCRQVFE